MTTTVASVHAEPVQKSSLNLSKSAMAPPSGINPPIIDPVRQLKIIQDLPDPKLLTNEKVQRMRASLFDSDDDDDLEGGTESLQHHCESDSTNFYPINARKIP